MPTRKTLRTRTKKLPRRPREAARRGCNLGKLFLDLVKLQARLRAPNGCPWDLEQTHASLRSYLVEECYEVLDALDRGDDAGFAEELGDLLLQIIFHAELAREMGRFDIGDVIERVHTKMVRRHPHVFGDTEAATSAQVLKNWEKLKEEERRASGKAPAKAGSVLDGVPRSLPAVLEALQLTRRVSHIGFDWENAEGVLEKIREEVAELCKAVAAEEAQSIEEEAGDLLFAAVNLARVLKVDPELALRRANRKFSERFRWMERQAENEGSRLADVGRARMEELWEASKIRP